MEMEEPGPQGPWDHGPVHVPMSPWAHAPFTWGVVALLSLGVALCWPIIWRGIGVVGWGLLEVAGGQ